MRDPRMQRRWARTRDALRQLSLLAVVVGTFQFGAGPAAASASGICPARGQTDRFTDDDGNTHEASVSCAASYGLVGGTGPTKYNPGANLTRGQAATILVNFVERSGAIPMPAGRPGTFTDTAGTTHEGNIDKAAQGGLLSGFNDGSFRPDVLITRAQFATITVRATERLLDAAMTSPAGDVFDDENGSIHESNIEKAAHNRVLNGVGARRFGPASNVTRGQAASIVIGAAGNVLDPANRFAAKLSATVEWSNDRAWVEVTSSDDLLWSRSWRCIDGKVEVHELQRHEGEAVRSARHTGEGLLLIDFTYKKGPPVRRDGRQVVWYSSLTEPGNTESGPYTIGEYC